MPTNFKRPAEEKAEDHSLAKKPRLDKGTGIGVQDSIAGEIKKRLADKLEAPQEGGKLSINKDKLK